MMRAFAVGLAVIGAVLAAPGYGIFILAVWISEASDR